MAPLADHRLPLRAMRRAVPGASSACCANTLARRDCPTRLPPLLITSYELEKRDPWLFKSDRAKVENLYTNSIVVLDVRTGALRWTAQLVPSDYHDWDLTHASPLFRTAVGNRRRDLVATVGKDGLLRVLDRGAGERLYEVPVPTRENTDAAVTTTGVHACPGALGGVEWNGPAYSPVADLLYVNGVDWCTTLWRPIPSDTSLARITWAGERSGTPSPRPADGSRRLTPRPERCAGATSRPRRSWRRSRPLLGVSCSPANSRAISSCLTRARARCSTASTPAARWTGGLSRMRWRGNSTWPRCPADHRVSGWASTPGRRRLSYSRYPDSRRNPTPRQREEARVGEGLCATVCRSLTLDPQIRPIVSR